MPRAMAKPTTPRRSRCGGAQGAAALPRQQWGCAGAAVLRQRRWPTWPPPATPVQDAIAAANDEEKGGIVYLPAGTYKLTRPLTIMRSNVVLRGDGVSAAQPAGDCSAGAAAPL